MSEWNHMFVDQPDDGPKTIGQLLKQMRIEAEFTQTELAKRVGVSRETVVNIEKDNPPTVDSLDAKVIRKWRRACGLRISIKTLMLYKHVIMAYFKV